MNVLPIASSPERPALPAEFGGLPHRLLFRNAHLSLWLVGFTREARPPEVWSGPRSLLMITAGEAATYLAGERVVLREGDCVSIQSGQRCPLTTEAFADALLFVAGEGRGGRCNLPLEFGNSTEAPPVAAY